MNIHGALCLPCGSLSPVTALAAAVHKSVGLNFTWFGDSILKQMSVPLCYLLSQPPQQHHCSRKQRQHSLSASLARPKPPESVPTAPAPTQAQPLAFGSYTDTKCCDDDVQTIPQCLQLFVPVQTCFCSGRGGLLLPKISQTTTTGILQTFTACDELQLLGIQKSQHCSTAGKGNNPPEPLL